MKQKVESIKLSVILNTFNRPEFTRKALLSLQHQSLLPGEVIISDDGSSDSQLPLLEELKPDLKFPLIFVSQKHSAFRLARCRNNGVLAASGDYLVFVDQDLLLTRDYLMTHRAYARRGCFLVPQVIRLTEDQSTRVSTELIEQCNFATLLTRAQLQKNQRQYYQDTFYYVSRRLGYRTHRPKLKGGLFSIFKQDLIRVNGYDEKYQGWGNEDDDLGRRLYAAKIYGRNPFWGDYALHLYHEPYHQSGERINDEYYRKRIVAINTGDYRCEQGLAERDLTGLTHRVFR
ncbi:MAG: glycosyltransferase [Candidatus Delongbacteria bacterium]|nr:glycosyltransferase [Candidatus Delongbacteria bacterium]